MIRHLLIATIFCISLMPFNAFCVAEVVDDSENYALLDEHQAAQDSPDVQNNTTYDDEPALAKENSEPATTNSSALLDKIHGLQQEIQELRGQIEVQAHDLKLLQEQQLAFYKDLDARLTSKGVVAPVPKTDLDIGSQTPPPSASLSSPPPLQHVINGGRVNPAEEQISYLAAYELIKNKHFDEALPAMQQFVLKYPHGGYTANAQY